MCVCVLICEVDYPQNEQLKRRQMGLKKGIEMNRKQLAEAEAMGGSSKGEVMASRP